jgi:hypothetical protein
VKQQGFLIGKGRPLAARAAVIGSHFKSLLLTPCRILAGFRNCSECAATCSRERPNAAAQSSGRPAAAPQKRPHRRRIEQAAVAE